MKKYILQFSLIFALICLTLGDCVTTKMGLERGFIERVSASSYLLEQGNYYLIRALMLIPIVVALGVVLFTKLKWLYWVIDIPVAIECVILLSAVINNSIILFKA